MLKVRSRALSCAATVVLAALGVACGSPSVAPHPPADAGPDASDDGGPPPADAGPDASDDGGPLPADAGPDASDDGGPLPADAGPDAPEDGGPLPGDGGPLARVFLTKAGFTGDLRTQGGGTTGLDGGDKLCQQAAEAAGLSGTFKAWLSDATANAIDRLDDVGGWYMAGPAPSLVFASKAGITGGPSGAIADEHGNYNFNTPWTGTRPNGTAETAATDPYIGTVSVFAGTSTNCKGWTVSTQDSGAQGAGGMTEGFWTEGGLQQCQNSAGLYCFQQ
jgi:hypothetical protein